MGWAAVRRPRGILLPQGAASTGDAPPIVVVAKSAQLRFRLRRKLRPLPCSSSPHRAGRGGGPFRSCQKRNGPCTVQKKRPLRRAPARSRLRATGVGGSVQAPILACLRARYHLLRFLGLPSRGGWCGSCRGARTHLTSFSFRAFRFATRCPGGRRGRCLYRQLPRGTASGSEKRSSSMR